MRLGTASACSCSILLLRLRRVSRNLRWASVGLADCSQFLRMALLVLSCSLLRHIQIVQSKRVGTVLVNILMGACETCSREAEYNAIDSDDLMHQLENTPIAMDIAKLRADNRDTLANCHFTPMSDKSFYKGKLTATRREGYGENYAGCFNYFGFYLHDLPHGQGAIITDHQCFVGNFQHGVIQGEGKEWSNGVTFQGTYRQGEREEGLLSSELYSYTGTFQNGLFHGKGTLKQTHGIVYEGEFRAGQFEGQGKATFEGGSTYRGAFKNGLYHGYGEFHWHNGNSYRGQYEEGRRHGFGVLKIGAIEYSGTWNKGSRDGHGILTHENELAFGNWQNNMLVEE